MPSYSKRLSQHFIRLSLKIVSLILGLKIKSNYPKPQNKEQTIIYVANHESYLDFLAIIVASKNYLNFLAWNKLFFFQIKKLHRFIKHIGILPIRQPHEEIHTNQSGFPSGLRSALKILKKEKVLVIFPQGERDKEGMLGKFFNGTEWLAKKFSKETNQTVHLIPLHLEGTFEIWPKDQLMSLKNNKQISVLFGKPIIIHPDNDYEKGELTSELHSNIKHLEKLNCLT